MTVTPALHVYSFGWGHQDPNVPHADITCDVRDWFRNPDIDPKLRDLNGRDQAVIDEVLNTWGVKPYLNGLFVITMPLIRRKLRTVTVTIGCAGGRHRAPVIAEQLATDVAMLLDVTTATTHMHIDRPILPPGSSRRDEIQDAVTRVVRSAADKLAGNTVVQNVQAVERAIARSNSCATCWPRPCYQYGRGEELRPFCKRRGQ